MPLQALTLLRCLKHFTTHLSLWCNSSVSLCLHLFNGLLRTFNREDLLNDEVKLLLGVLFRDRTMREHLKFILRSVLRVFSVGVEGSNEEESLNNDIMIEESWEHFLHFFRNRLYLTGLILNLDFNLSAILSFSFAAAAVCFFIASLEVA